MRHGCVAQLVRAFASHARGRGFESLHIHDHQRPLTCGNADQGPSHLPNVSDTCLIDGSMCPQIGYRRQGYRSQARTSLGGIPRHSRRMCAPARPSAAVKHPRHEGQVGLHQARRAGPGRRTNRRFRAGRRLPRSTCHFFVRWTGSSGKPRHLIAFVTRQRCGESRPVEPWSGTLPWSTPSLCNIAELTRVQSASIALSHVLLEAAADAGAIDAGAYRTGLAPRLAAAASACSDLHAIARDLTATGPGEVWRDLRAAGSELVQALANLAPDGTRVAGRGTLSERVHSCDIPRTWSAPSRRTKTRPRPCSMPRWTHAPE